MKRLFVLSAVLSLSFSFSITAQHRIQVRGKIMDAESGTSLPYATVFVNNTTLGTTADSLGNYTLHNVPGDQPDLIFSFVGYETQHHTIMPSSGADVVVDIQLKPIKNLLDQVVVEGKKDKQWNKYYKRFIKDFFGETPNAALCEIANPGELSFSVDEKFYFRAKADHPLEIYNRALGYKIQVNLRSFAVRDKAYSVSYFAQFSELKPRDARELLRWQVGRLKSYRGSPRHFFKSMVDGRSEKEGYRIYYDKGNGSYQILIRVPPEALVPQKSNDPGKTDYFQLLQKGVFRVVYLNAFTPKIKRVYSNDGHVYSDFMHPVSWITVLNEFVLCPASGVARSTSNFSLSGDMSGYRMAELLPDDYDPTANEARLYFERQSFHGSVSGIVRDSTSGMAIEGTRVFVNNTPYQTQTDSAGRFEINNIPEGIYELVCAPSEYKVRHQKIQIRQDSLIQLQILMSSDDIDWISTLPAERTLAYFKKYVLKGHSGIRVLNPEVLAVGVSHGTSQLRATHAIELDDTRRGYRIHYYLKGMSLSGTDRMQSIGFCCFDTLFTKNYRVRNKWVQNRFVTYRGSISHFLRSLAESRVREEGFELYSTLDSTGVKKNWTRLDAEALMVKTDGSMMELNIPAGTILRFENQGTTQVQTLRNVFVSAFGILSDPEAFKLEGGLKMTNPPMLPLDYRPIDDAVRSSRVTAFRR